ncbi:alpha/beta fold hydrolase [Nakamurella sp. GG22]
MWRDRRLGVVAAIALAAAFGLLSGWLIPRGPVTGLHAVTAMVAAFGVGAFAGFVMRSRWAMLLAPAVFVAVFELVRFGAAGPTVDALDLTNLLGVVIAAVGRGFQGVLSLVPMALGAALGAGVARRLHGQPAARPGGWGTTGLVVRRGVAAVVAIGLVVLGVFVARPGHTAPIVGVDGQPVAGSVAELTRAEIGGHELSMLIRGDDATNPVLLFLAGGPGGAEFGAMRRHGQALEQDFVVVTLDQRGTGSSYDQIEPTSTLTLQEAVNDVAGVSNYLRERFSQEKVYLVGQSWGTTLGVLAVQAHPDLFHAFVGVGQMVSQRATDLIFYEDTLAWARTEGNAELAAELVAMGPPPWTDFLNYSTVLGYEQDVYPYDHQVNAEGAGQMTESLPVGEYGLLDTVNLARGLSDSFALMYPQLQQIDFRVDVPTLDVPVYLAEGRYEPRGRSDLAAEWFSQLEAPDKMWIEFPTSGHRPIFEQPELFHQLMTNTVLVTSTGGTG